jgi:chromosome segregation ATPase
MNNGNITMGKSMFGYNIKEVNRHLSDLQFTLNEKFREIEAKISNYKNENARLKEEIEKLQVKRHEKLEAEEITVYALGRAEQVSVELSKSIKKEVAELENECLRQESLLDKKIDEAEKEIKNMQEELSFLLKKVLEKGIKNEK